MRKEKKTCTLKLKYFYLIQFLLSQLVLSYGMYAIHFINKYDSIIETILPPLILLVTPKILCEYMSEFTQYGKSVFLCILKSLICIMKMQIIL